MVDGETHRMLDGRLADIGSEINELTAAVEGLGAILLGFFRAYASAETERPLHKGGSDPESAVWRDYLTQEEEEEES